MFLKKHRGRDLIIIGNHRDLVTADSKFPVPQIYMLTLIIIIIII